MTTYAKVRRRVALESKFLMPSVTVSEARAQSSDPMEIVRIVHARLVANGQRSTRDALRTFISSARVVGERGRDRTGGGFGFADEREFSAIQFAVEQFEIK